MIDFLSCDWLAKNENKKGSPQSWIVVDRDRYVCRVMGSKYNRQKARLIAAAPDLLAAAEHALRAPTQFYVNENEPDSIENSFLLLEAAVKKARGGK